MPSITEQKKKQWKGELQLNFAGQLNILFPINSKKLLTKKNKLKSWEDSKEQEEEDAFESRLERLNKFQQQLPERLVTKLAKSAYFRSASTESDNKWFSV